MTNQLKAGDRVRVTFEAVYDEMGLIIRHGQIGAYAVEIPKGYADIELLPPEPTPLAVGERGA